MWKYIRLYHNSPSQEPKKPLNKFITKKLLLFPLCPVLPNSTNTELGANQQVLHLLNRGHTLPQHHGALQGQHGTNLALGTIRETLGWSCTDAVAAVITKWPFSPTAAPGQDRTKQTQPCRGRGTKAPGTGQCLPGEGCWHSQEHCQGLSWSRTLQHRYFWLIKGAKSSYFHSLVKTPVKLTREMIWKLLFSAGL